MAWLSSLFGAAAPAGATAAAVAPVAAPAAAAPAAATGIAASAPSWLGPVLGGLEQAGQGSLYQMAGEGIGKALGGAQAGKDIGGLVGGLSAFAGPAVPPPSALPPLPQAQPLAPLRNLHANSYRQDLENQGWYVNPSGRLARRFLPSV